MANGSFISLDQAIQMTQTYRGHLKQVLNPLNPNILPNCETFDRSLFDALLQQDGCVGVRIYYGMDEGLNVHAIVVGVDAGGSDILPPAAGTDPTARAESLGDEGLIIDNATRCPQNCPPSSVLNG